jgi:hypothetical protein
LRTLVAADFPEIDGSSGLTHPWDDVWRRLEKLALLTRPEAENNDDIPINDRRNTRTEKSVASRSVSFYC